jgi:hypothetical protein
MSTITIGAPRQYVDRGWPAIAAHIQIDDQHMDLYFRCSQGPLSSSCAPFVLSMLLPAMKLGASIHAPTPLSPQLVATQEKFQQVFTGAFKWLQHAPLGPVADTNSAAPSASQADERGVFLFFSGGVDSFYTLLERQQEITHCVFVHGFDALLADAGVRARNVQAMRQAAAELGKPLIEIETNYRSCVDRIERWNHHSAMTAQFAIACALSPQFKRGYVAENYNYFGRIQPPGTEQGIGLGEVTLVQHGLECLRLDKTIRIAASESAMRWLRVCWQNKDKYNCGRCEKCLRTMIALHIAGALSRCRTFDRAIDLQRVRYLRYGDSAYFWPELLAVLERWPEDAALAEAVRDSSGWATMSDWLVQRLTASLQRKGEANLLRIVNERVAYAQTAADPRQQTEQVCKAMTRVFDLQDELAVIKSSRSWKLTAPLRRLGARLR